MAFFDKLSKTVTEASQKTMAKTMELADVARLNSMISDEERTISELYAQIGKLYRTLHQNDYEANFAGMIKAIIESEDKIDQYHSQILDIKGVQRCGNCGAEVLKGAAFCSACGAVMPEPQSKMTEERATSFMRRRWRTCGRKNRQFKMLSDGIDYSAGNATALSLVELYIPIRTVSEL